MPAHLELILIINCPSSTVRTVYVTSKTHQELDWITYNAYTRLLVHGLSEVRTEKVHADCTSMHIQLSRT